jgi:hypothetical protein
MNRSLLAIAFINATLLLVGCFPDPPERTTGGDDPPTTPAPDAAVGGPDAPAASGYDPAVFKSVVQPMVDRYGCSKNGCHGSGIGGFMLIPDAVGAAVDTNFAEVTKRNNATEPEKSRVYFKGVNAHGGSQAYSAPDAQKVLDWIKAGAKKP